MAGARFGRAVSGLKAEDDLFEALGIDSVQALELLSELVRVTRGLLAARPIENSVRAAYKPSCDECIGETPRMTWLLKRIATKARIRVVKRGTRFSKK